MSNGKSIAYFTMEIALETGMPTYSGGLGVLAGDTVRAAADLKVPMVAVTLLHRKGYFYQRLDASGMQHEEPVDWVVEDYLQELPQQISLVLENRTLRLRSWRYEVTGVSGYKVPVYFLDTDLPENTAWDRTLTHYLYGGDECYRLCQEAVLGMGGVKILRALGHENIDRFHMNEGHASLLTLRLLEEEAERANRKAITRDDVEAVREKCIFTTHTPVPAGHDRFPKDLVSRVLGNREVFAEMVDIFCYEHLLNMTHLALNLSHYVNGVAKKHGEVTREMFAGYSIDAITNGVHAVTWTSAPFRDLFDRYIRGWRYDSFSLRYALSIPKEDVWRAHIEAKKQLLHYVNRETNAGMDIHVLTLGFARRATAYKRGDLLFTDLERLKRIAAEAGEIQIIFSGKAHPKDQTGKELIKTIMQAKRALDRDIRVAYVENYDLALGGMITAGVDLWLNTPQPPLEASGTSGMKAALNGVPSFSILDGWWIEGCLEGITGWAIGENGRMGTSADRQKDAAALYEKLEKVIIPMFYNDRDRYSNVMLHAIALNGSFFNTHRMVLQYVLKAYF
ncbi:MAG TPA: alpha-glucan family phosphorylase [Candidatus Binatia bacterium]